MLSAALLIPAESSTRYSSRCSEFRDLPCAARRPLWRRISSIRSPSTTTAPKEHVHVFDDLSSGIHPAMIARPRRSPPRSVLTAALGIGSTRNLSSASCTRYAGAPAVRGASGLCRSWKERHAAPPNFRRVCTEYLLVVRTDANLRAGSAAVASLRSHSGQGDPSIHPPAAAISPSLIRCSSSACGRPRLSSTPMRNRASAPFA